MTPTWLTSVDITVAEIALWNDENTVTFISCTCRFYVYSWWKPQCRLKVPHIFVFSPGYLCYCDVYRNESMSTTDENHSVGWKFLIFVFSPGYLCYCDVYRRESRSTTDESHSVGWELVIFNLFSGLSPLLWYLQTWVRQVMHPFLLFNIFYLLII